MQRLRKYYKKLMEKELVIKILTMIKMSNYLFILVYFTMMMMIIVCNNNKNKWNKKTIEITRTIKKIHNQ
jgi:hypothetical protein